MTTRAEGPATGQTTLRLGVLTDLHLAAPGTPPTRFNNTVHLDRSRDLLRTALHRLSPDVDAFVLLGDLAQSATAEDYTFLVDRLAETGRPSYLIPGNHDLPAGRTAGEFPTMATGEILLHPATPSPAGVDGAGTLIACAALEPHRDGHRIRDLDILPPIHPTNQPDQPDQPLIWLTHFPLLSMHDQIIARGWLYAGDLINRAATEQRLSRYPGPVIVLSGHLHVRGHAMSGNILQLSHAALTEAPHDAAVVAITADADRLDVERHCFPLTQLDDALPTVLDPVRTAFRWRGGQWQWR